MTNAAKSPPAMVIKPLNQTTTTEPEYPNSWSSVVPNRKVCPITTMGHAYLYHQLLRGEASKHVRTAHLREPGASRGKLFFHVGDMLRWLDKIVEFHGGRNGGGLRPERRSQSPDYCRL